MENYVLLIFFICNFSLVFVSTLDGKLSALDLANSGEKKWTVDFDHEPLISSSIHRKEVN